MTDQKKSIIGLVLSGLIYLLTRLVGLTALPVFADEAIYIRWAQMISNDAKQYAFLPLYDGKTPLYMWVLSQILWMSRSHPLAMGRLISVGAGLVTMVVIVMVTRNLGGSRRAQLGASLIYLLLPFTFFHDRMALTDAMFVMFLSLTFLSVLKLKEKPNWKKVLVTGGFFGLSLLTKPPGLLFLGVIGLSWWMMPPKLGRKKIMHLVGYFAGAGVIGIGMLYSLRVSELFPFLFNRGSEFVYSWQDLAGRTNTPWQWWVLELNVSRFLRWMEWYLTLGLGGLLVAPFFYRGWRKSEKARVMIKLLILALGMSSYFLLAGKIIYSRYFLPLVIFLIPAASLAVDWLWEKRAYGVIGVCALLILGKSVWFMYPFVTDVGKVHLEAEDQDQYLTEWSAGFGNKEVSDYLKVVAESEKIAVATEGYFGTLPDGLSIYFDGSSLNDKVQIFGIGQPIVNLPKDVLEMTTTKPVYVVVNEYRLLMNPDVCCELVARYPRPYDGSDLLLLKVKAL